MAAPTLFEQIGGEPGLRFVVDRFVDRIFDDLMIGFLFRNASRERVKEKEYEFAAAHLGGPVVYTGKPIRAAHAAHGILGGQFNRRLQILRETLDDCGVPPAVKEHWVKHTEALRPAVTADLGSACDPTRSAEGSAR
jgi:hemoglobin